jgi:hypothetical protein
LFFRSLRAVDRGDRQRLTVMAVLSLPAFPHLAPSFDQKCFESVRKLLGLLRPHHRKTRFRLRSARWTRCRSTRTATAGRATGTQQRFRLAGQEAFALGPLAGELAGAPDGFGLLARLFFRGFFVMPAKLHLAENPLALHLLFQRLEGLVDIVITNENLHASSS